MGNSGSRPPSRRPRAMRRRCRNHVGSERELVRLPRDAGVTGATWDVTHCRGTSSLERSTAGATALGEARCQRYLGAPGHSAAEKFLSCI